MKFTISVVVFLQLCALLLADPIPEQRSLPQCTDSDFVVTVDNELTLYIDGVQVTSGLPNANTWPTADTIRVAASASVIGIKGVDNEVVAGILASGAQSTTDDSWKCTNTFHEGWAGVTFDDSAWPAATVIDSHGVDPWGTILGISNDAKWIWTPNHQYGPTSDKTVYCRKKRACSHGTGPTCITSCRGRTNGDYQSCKGCDVYATCSNGLLRDERPCAPGGLVWDDKKKRCERTSTTCGTGPSVPIDPPRPPIDPPGPSTSEPIDPPRPSCIKSCVGLANGDYQSCKGCRVYATCSNGHLTDKRPCPSDLVWDDNVKRCEWKSTTCNAGCVVRRK